MSLSVRDWKGADISGNIQTKFVPIWRSPPKSPPVRIACIYGTSHDEPTHPFKLTTGSPFHFIPIPPIRQWKAAKLRKTEDARLLEEVRALFLKQRPHELAEFGVDAEQQAENWAKAYLEVFHELQDIKAAGCGFFPRSDMLSEARLLTYLRQKQTVLKYRQTFRRRLAAYGCKPPPVPDTAERRETRRAHIRDRLLTLEYNRLESVLNYMGVNVPKEFFLCMCRMAGYHAPPARSDFSPGIYVKPPDERYACQQPGPPCIVSGYGCTRHPLINRNHTSAENRQIIESCLEQESGAGRERIDVMLERLMR